MVLTRIFEPWTRRFKARSNLRRTPPQGSLRIGFSAPRLPRSSAWLYKLAIYPRALSDRSARANAKRRGLLPTSLLRATALRGGVRVHRSPPQTGVRAAVRRRAVRES